MSEYLLTLTAMAGLVTQTVYVGTVGHLTAGNDAPANTYFEPRVVDPGNFEQHLFSDGATRGQSSVGSGDIIVARLDAGNGANLDAWGGWNWNGGSVTIVRWPGSGLVSAAEVAFVGKIERLLANADTYTIQIHDRLSDLDKPLLTARYGGTTTSTGPTADGNEDLAGQIIQNLWGGPNYDVDCQPANIYDLIYKVRGGEVAAVELFDGGLALDFAADYPTLAQLQSATWPADSASRQYYATCLSEGLVRTDDTPFFKLTAHVTEGNSLAARSGAQLVLRMLDHFGVVAAQIDSASFTVLDAINSAPCGIVVKDEETCLSAVNRVLASFGGWLIADDLGRFSVGALRATTESPSLSLDDTQFGDLDYIASNDEDKGVPIWRATVRYAQANVTLAGFAFAGAISPERRTFLASEWRSSTPAQDAAVLANNALAPEMTIDSRFVNKADADAEAIRLLAFYDGATFVKVPIPDLNEIAGLAIGAEIALTVDDLGFDAGAEFIVLGMVKEFEDDVATLVVRGG